MIKEEQKRIFNQWLSQCKALIFKIVKAYTIDPNDEEDLFQDICIQVWKSIPNFEERSAITTWIYRISLNTAIKWSAKAKKHTSGRERLSNQVVIAENPEVLDEKTIWLYAEIKKMNEVDRSLTLLLLDGFSYKKISEITGISESNVGVKIHRIKKSLVEASNTYSEII